MTIDVGIDWEDAFDNRTYIDGADQYPADWAALAKKFRDNHRTSEIDLRYGDTPRETLDLFLPDDTASGLVVFVHGGFWKSFDKSYWSHLANGPLLRGFGVAIAGYTLAPKATLPQMVHKIARAIERAAGRVSGPIRLAGHSASCHLVTRMICADTPLAGPVFDRIDNVQSISGLHDLRPLLLFP